MNDASEPLTPVPAHRRAEGASRNKKRLIGDLLILIGVVISVLLLTGIAAVISYHHTYRVVTEYGETGNTARALPLTVDGLVAVCSLTILRYTRRQKPAPWHAWALLFTGITASIAANVANGLDHGPVGAIVAGWASPVAAGGFHLLICILRDGHTPEDEQPRSTQPQSTEPDPAASLSPEAELLLLAIEHYAPMLADRQLPATRAIMRELRIGHPRAAPIHTALKALRPLASADLGQEEAAA